MIGDEGSGRGKQPAEVVSELIAAIRDGRAEDACALVDPAVVIMPAARPARSVYEGQDGLTVMIADLRGLYGRWRYEIDHIAAQEEEPGEAAARDAATQVRVRIRVFPETPGLRPPPVTSVFTVRGGLVTFIDAVPD